MSGNRGRLLVVEDDPDVAAGLETYARSQGYDVAVARTGLQALDLARSLDPEVILLDISLPQLDGRDVLRHLRREGSAANAVVVFLTARDAQSDRLVGLELGADEYETKPFHFDTLFRKIATLLRKKRRERQR